MYEIGHFGGRDIFAPFRNRTIYLFSRRNQCFIPRSGCKNGYFGQCSKYSVQNILYVLCEKDGQCLQSEISKLTGISRQTINSAIRKLEKEEIVYLKQGKGRNTILCLTEKGKKFSSEKIMPLHEIENKIWNEWTEEEQQQYLTLTKKYRDGLKKYLEAML